MVGLLMLTHDETPDFLIPSRNSKSDSPKCFRVIINPFRSFLVTIHCNDDDDDGLQVIAGERTDSDQAPNIRERQSYTMCLWVCVCIVEFAFC